MNKVRTFLTWQTNKLCGHATPFSALHQASPVCCLGGSKARSMLGLDASRLGQPATLQVLLRTPPSPHATHSRNPCARGVRARVAACLASPPPIPARCRRGHRWREGAPLAAAPGKPSARVTLPGQGARPASQAHARRRGGASSASGAPLVAQPSAGGQKEALSAPQSSAAAPAPRRPS